MEVHRDLIEAVEDDQDIAASDKSAKIGSVGLFASLPAFAEDRVDQIVNLDMLEAATALLQRLAWEQAARVAHVQVDRHRWGACVCFSLLAQLQQFEGKLLTIDGLAHTVLTKECEERQ